MRNVPVLMKCRVVVVTCDAFTFHKLQFLCRNVSQKQLSWIELKLALLVFTMSHDV